MQTTQLRREPEAASAAIAARHALREMKREAFVYPQLQTRGKQIAASAPTVYADMHPGVYGIALLCWAPFMAVFFVTFHASANATFMVDISGAYAVMFFGVPFVMSRAVPRKEAVRSGLRDFLGGSVDTLYGPVNSGEALLQVIMIPLALTLGGIAIGFIIHADRIAY